MYQWSAAKDSNAYLSFSMLNILVLSR